MTRPAQPESPRPWLTLWRPQYEGSIPTQAACAVCDVVKRIQGPRSAAKFLRTHRRCGVGFYEKVVQLR